MRLYLFKQAFCDHCEDAHRFLSEWELKNPGRMIVLRVDPNLFDITIGGFRAKKTPSYVIVDGSTLISKLEGDVLDVQGLEAFVKAAEAGAPA